MSISERPRILSGVQPSGKLHLGNYFGAIKQHIERQDSGDCFYFIADYHALTTLKEAEEKEIAAYAKGKQIPPKEERQTEREKIQVAFRLGRASGQTPRPAAQILADNV